MSRRYTYHERQQTYASIRRILTAFEQDDFRLAKLSELAQADGYPAGGDGSGHSAGDHSDPTAAAVSARVDGTDPASQAFAALQEALIAFGQADQQRRRALPTDQPEAKPKSTSGDWCTSCARARRGDGTTLHVPLPVEKHGGRQDLCHWCRRFWLESSDDPTKRKLPDPRLCLARADGVRLTPAKLRELLAEPKRKRKRSA